MRNVIIPVAAMEMLKAGHVPGRALEVLVEVDWPELLLTPEQSEANAMAAAVGAPRPHPEHRFFTITLPVV